jgi:hypothetical protein
MLPMQVTTYLRIMDGDRTPHVARGPTVDVCRDDGGHSWISVSTLGARGPSSTFVVMMVGALGSPSAPPRGAAVDVCRIDGGRFQISVSTSQWGRH